MSQIILLQSCRHGRGSIKLPQTRTKHTRTKDENMTADQKISALKPGQSVTISSGNGITVSAERSGNGKLLRIVRSDSGGFSVIKSTRW